MNKSKGKKTINIWTKLLYFVVGFFVKLAITVVMGFRLKTDPQVRQWKKSKKSFVILCAHPSEMDAVVLLAAAFPRYARFVVGAQQLYKGTLGKVLRSFKVIPKKQFVPDIKAIMEMMKTVKSGYVLGMMPEGRVSMDGTANPIEESTAKLLKKLGVPVALLIPHGTYFVKPPYNFSGLKLGKIGGELKPLFSEEDLKSLSPEDIFQRITQECCYNASEELRGSGQTYGSKITGLTSAENLFYICPKCGAKYTIEAENNKIVCRKCGMEMGLSGEMFFITDDPDLPDTVAGWNAIQKEYEKKYWSEPNAKLCFEAEESMLTIGESTEYKPCAKGILTLSAEGLLFESDYETLRVPLHSIPGVSADYQWGHFLFYQGNDIRKFKFNDIRSVAEFVNSLMCLKSKEQYIED